jgi:hypothetical protein
MTCLLGVRKCNLSGRDNDHPLHCQFTPKIAPKYQDPVTTGKTQIQNCKENKSYYRICMSSSISISISMSMSMSIAYRSVSANQPASQYTGTPLLFSQARIQPVSK